MSTGQYIASRFIHAVFALLYIVTITFFLVRLAPGGPFDDERKIPEHLLEKMKEYYGFDKSLGTQYFIYMGNYVQGDLGPSLGNWGYSVNEVIAQGFPVSMRIGLLGLTIALSIGIPIGVIAAARRNTSVDYSFMSLALLGICLPTFVIGPMLAMLFGLRLNWFNAAGLYEMSDYFLPALTLGLYYAAYVARLTRGGMLDVLNQDFIRTAKSKGVPPMKILFKHAFRGGISPVVAFLGPALAGLISGSFVVETIFGLPGLGQHFIRAATNRDYTLILGTVSVFAILILTLNFLVDIVQTWLDPRRKLKA